MSTPSQRITKLEFIIGFILLNIVLMFYVFSWLQTKISISNSSKNNFFNQSEYITHLIENRIHELQEATKNGKRLFDNDEEISRNEFAGFFGGDEEDERYAGIKGILYVDRVKEADKTSFLQKIRSDKSVSRYGYPFFNIQSYNQKKEYLVVNYLQPFEENKTLFGFDVSSDPVLASYFTEAVNSNKIVTTPKVHFLNTEVILIILPLYKNSNNTSDSLKGFLVTLIEPGIMFDGFLSETTQKMGLSIYDGDIKQTQMHQFTPLYEDSNETKNHTKEERLATYKKVMFGDRPWTVNFYSNTMISTSWEEMLPNIFFFGGSILTLIMFVLLSEAIAAGTPEEKKI